MSQFPNAKKGISRIFTAQILSLVATLVIAGATVALLSAFGSMSALMSYSAAIGIEDLSDSQAGIAVFASLAMLVAAIVLLAAWVMQIMGLSQAAKDNASFKTAIMVIIAGIAFSILGSLIGYGSIATLCNSLSSVAQLVVMLLIIKGVTELLPGSSIAERGKKLSTLCVVAVVAGAVCNILAGMFTVAGILALVSSICYLVFYVGFLMYLSKAKKAL